MRTFVVFLALLSVCLVGCKGSSVVGHWKGDANLTGDAAKNPMASIATGMANAMTIDFKSDNTFAMTMGLTMNGTWSQSGNTVTLTPKGVQGMDTSGSNGKPTVLTLSGDGNTLTPQDANSAQGSFVFKRG